MAPGAGPVGARTIFDALVDAYPEALTREEPASRSGFEVSGGSFRTYVSKLRVLELIEGRGELRAAAVFFER